VVVKINAQALLDSIPAPVVQGSRRLLAEGCVGQLDQAGGGVQALVHGGGQPVQPWVGVVDGAFVGECECSDGVDDLCVHAVAVVMRALDEGVRWSWVATPPSGVVIEPEQARFVEAAERLARGQLVALVADQAGTDRLFAAKLLEQSGQLGALDASVVDTFRAGVRGAVNVVNDSKWELSDLTDAGRRIVAEVEVLMVRPATIEILDLVEEAIAAWDSISGDLHAAYRVRGTDPEEISEPLADAHLELCEQLDLDPIELGERLAGLVNRCEFDALDAPDAYESLLADEGLSSFEKYRRR
jgi:uncharacterized Zn finger protein